MFAPPLLIIGALASVTSPEATTYQTTTLPQQHDNGVASEPNTFIASEEPITTYPVTVVKTGLDFQYTYEGELKAYSDKTVIEATWTPECGDSAPVDFQTQRFTYTLPTSSSQMETKNEYSDCFGQEGVSHQSDPYQVDADGTIRVDLVEPSDGSLIREDFIVITSGPIPEERTVSETIADPADEASDIPYAADLDAEPQTAVAESIEEELQVESVQPTVYYSTCKEYNEAGLGNFTTSDPEYSSRRDRDKDGIACEF